MSAVADEPLNSHFITNGSSQDVAPIADCGPVEELSRYHE